MIGNTPRRETNIQLESSKSFVFGVLFKKVEDGSYLDLTGCVVRLVASQPAYLGGIEILNIEAEHVSDAGGLVQFQFQASDLALAPGSYPYDVTLITALNYSVPVIKGFIEIGGNTDQDIDNVFTDIHADSEVTAYIGDANVVEIVIERVDGMLGVVQELIANFTTDMQAQVDTAEASAALSEFWSTKTTSDIAELQAWMASIGFPYWIGTASQYAGLGAPDPTVLYLLTD